MSRPRFGLSCAVSTPFAADGAIDIPRLVAHARRVRSDGAATVTVFGTTGEGFSIGPAERQPVFDALRAAGFDAARELGAGVMAASVEEAAAQARQALDAGCRHLLVAPPFYAKGVGDDGLYDWHASLVGALGADCRGVVVYNLPSQTGITLSHALIGRLKSAFPGVVIGVKDSSGTWPYTERLLAEHGDLAILIGDERHLARAVRAGGEGSICGLANTHAHLLTPMVDGGAEQPAINALVEAVLSVPVLPAIKALIAERTGDPAWHAARAPIAPLSPEQREALLARVRGIAGV
ncbi:MAG: dihydrodipicolinate synthase family protein [Hyphomicrobiaceae bacterium]